MSWVPYIGTTVNYLKSLPVSKVLVLGLKNQHPDGLKFLAKHVFTPENHKIRTFPHENVQVMNPEIQMLDADFEYFDLLENFCNETGCQRITREGHLIIFDGSHLTPYGAKLIGKNLKHTDWYQSILHSNR